MESRNSKISKFYDGYELSEDDLELISSLKVPLSSDEPKRLEVLRETKLVDSNPTDLGFDRISTLASRLFNVS